MAASQHCRKEITASNLPQLQNVMLLAWPPPFQDYKMQWLQCIYYTMLCPTVPFLKYKIGSDYEMPGPDIPLCQVCDYKNFLCQDSLV